MPKINGMFFITNTLDTFCIVFSGLIKYLIKSNTSNNIIKPKINMRSF